MKIPPTTETARITEIFSSIQGEGTRMGERHLFVRFEECHMHCHYCDELDKVGRDWSRQEVLEKIQELEVMEGPHSFVSLTGGEPLLYLNFIQPLIQELKEKGHKIFLETSGVLWKALESVIENCDVIAMDLKPSSVTHEGDFLLEHRKFLEIAKTKETFIKIVLSQEIDLKEFEDHVKLVASIASETPIFLQPMTEALKGHENPELMTFLSKLQTLGKKWHPDIRIGMRLHELLNVK